jgi:hypothetical protein
MRPRRDVSTWYWSKSPAVRFEKKGKRWPWQKDVAAGVAGWTRVKGFWRLLHRKVRMQGAAPWLTRRIKGKLRMSRRRSLQVAAQRTRACGSERATISSTRSVGRVGASGASDVLPRRRLVRGAMDGVSTGSVYV